MKTLSLIGSMLATAFNLIITLEQALPIPGLGATKKQIALSVVTTSLQAATGIENATGHPEIAAMTSLASSFIDQTVATLKAAKAGPFAVSTSDATAAPAA